MPENKQPKTTTPKDEVERDLEENESKNEGEGSRSGARAYDAAATKAAQDPARVKKLADDAKQALEGPEGQKLREAEQRGKSHQHR
jgi:hypothetical protein